MSSTVSKIYEKTNNILEKKVPLADTILWLNAVAWQILLFMNFLSTGNVFFIVPVIPSVTSILFLEKYRHPHKRKHHLIRKIYPYVYSLTYGLWLGFTIMFLLTLTKI
ncbi:hypothetical protein [Archaeoglobus sp. JdFR-39]|jgi:hypothetical protein|uniref:hypothetical protein n=1 Tax=Archaeoglobus sp. JdFR-39 TaxID=1934996 RepID=UPI0025C40A28|nr:hypothetical protein [Archaeoglobus sp. JdFR-39]